MAKKTFSDGEVLKHAWQKLQGNIGLMISSILVVFALSLLPLLIGVYIDSQVAIFVLFLFYIGFSWFLYIGLIRLFIAVSDGEKASLKMLFSGADRLLPFIAVSFLYAALVLFGYFLFIIPGVIWTLKYMFAPWLIVDQKMQVMESFEKSREMTDGLKWDLLGFYMVMSVVTMLGVMAFYIGIIITMPLAMLSFAKLYRTIGPKSAKA